MRTKDNAHNADLLLREWPLPSAVTLGSAVRAKGIEQVLRRSVPWSLRKQLTVAAGRVALAMPRGQDDAFRTICIRMDEEIARLSELPVLPSEIEDILTISSRERLKWLADGRLQSAGTRTVKLRGRAKAVTFHVFDPRHVEDILNADRPELWREEDAERAAENRKRAAAKAAMKRANKAADVQAKPEDATSDLKGWDAFDAEGFLR